MKIYTIDEYTLLDNIDADFPTKVIIPNKETVHIPKNMTAYGFVAKNDASLITGEKTLILYSHMYFCAPGDAIINNLSGFICIKENYHGLLTLGGPTEKKGRMKYIDGCSDTLLLAPLMCGEPCLNYLYVPANINQTPHTHPTVRVGYVLEGAGYCKSETGRFNLLPGNIFVLPPEEIHSFHTDSNFLRIAVYHPDSDFGPTNEIHPMINKTYVEGVSLQGNNVYRTMNIME